MASDLFYGEGISKVNEATRPDVGPTRLKQNELESQVAIFLG